MNNRYSILDKGAWVNNSDGLVRKDEPMTEQSLKLENEVEILEDLLRTKKTKLDSFKDSDDAEISKNGARKTERKLLLFIGGLLVIFEVVILLTEPFTMKLLRDCLAHFIIFGSGSALLIDGAFKALCKDYERQHEIKLSLEDEVNYLEEELLSAKKRLDQLKREKRQDKSMDGEVRSLTDFNKSFEERQKRRLGIIRTLKTLKKFLKKNPSKDDINKLLLENGYSVEEIDAESDFIARRISLAPKKDSKGDK